MIAINRRANIIRLMLILLAITLVGIVILNGMTHSLSDIALPKTKKIFMVSRSCWELNIEPHSSVAQRLSRINLLSGKNETVSTSRIEASWNSIMNALEKIQGVIDDLRRLVETLQQMTQAFIDVVNELSYWIDKVRIDPSVLSSA